MAPQEQSNNRNMLIHIYLPLHVGGGFWRHLSTFPSRGPPYSFLELWASQPCSSRAL